MRYTVVLWLAASTLAFLLCLYDLSGTLVQGAFLPADHDSFYHARRILDAIPNPLLMYQFDPRIHAPEGSWITWPWAYDMMMAFIGKTLMAITGAKDPMSVLAFVAPAWVFVNAALLLGVSRRLGLSLPLQAIALLCYALSSLTRTLHRIGMMDHHYVEHTFVLALLFFGLGWFQQISSRRKALCLGVVLGIAPAFHNGLFILQLPVLIALACLWWLRRPIPVRAAATFAIALVVATAVFLLPSQPFRLGMFSFYLHSWFHLYVAVCSSVVCILMATSRRCAWTVAALLGIGALLTVPIVSQLVEGGDFFFARIIEYDKIQETQSIAQRVIKGDTAQINRIFSFLLWLMPLGVAWVCVRLRFDSGNSSIFFAVISLFGCIMLLQQLRFEYFGSFALYLPLCLFAEDMRSRSVRLGRAAIAVLGIVALLAHVPSLAGLRASRPYGGDFSYMLTRPIYPVLHDACAQQPGVVLAGYTEGHYITYHTDCSVIADGFILTRQHQQKVVQVRELLGSSLGDVLAKAPFVRYIYVQRADNIFAADSERCFPACPENKGLRHELLESGPPYPPELKLLAERELQLNGTTLPYARLFEVIAPQKN
jgi:hypothetical protein